MNDTTNEQDLARDHQRFQKLIRSALKAFLISIVVGVIGGYLVYMSLPTGKFPAVVLYIPGLIAVVVTCLPIRKRKKEWFPTPESLKAASEYKPPK
jgi:hypothetical protein